MFEFNLQKKNSGTNNSKIMYIYKYFTNLKVAYHIMNALWGFLVFVVIVNQCLTGIMLSFSLVNDCMLISSSREEEDGENNYIDDFFWLHERGVDALIITTFFHLLRKIYLGINDIEQEYSWKTGVFSFLIMQVTIFAGLVLCTTHLSEITLTIAVNALHTFFLFVAKPYWWFFTDKLLNTDTIIRMMYLHYCIAFFLLFFEYFVRLRFCLKFFFCSKNFVFIKRKVDFLSWRPALLGGQAALLPKGLLKRGEFFCCFAT